MIDKNIRSAKLILRATEKSELRKNILALLQAEGATKVTDLYIRLRVEQSVMSQQLGILRKSGVVTAKRDGQRIYYSVNTERYQFLTHTVNEFYQETGYSLVDCLRALGQEYRQDILNFIISSNNSTVVNRIYANFGSEQSITSQNLKILRLSNIVIGNKIGKFVLYAVNKAMVLKVQQAAEKIILGK